MRELSAPLRVTWDLPRDPERARTLWRRLGRGRVLFVEAQVTAQSVAALEGLEAPPEGAPAPRLSLLGGAAELAAGLARLGTDALAGSELLVLPPYAPPAAMDALRDGQRKVTPALWSTAEGVAELAAAAAAARVLGAAAVAVLNPCQPAAPLTAAQRAAAAQAWRATAADDLGLRVHDLFLAEELGLEPFRGYAGCQAASTLAHLDAEGQLRACRSLPLPLGDLGASELVTLWAAPERRSLAAQLAAAPRACAGCSLETSCRGGCRGYAPDLARDPACGGRRGAGADP